ncbi:MAG TPA: relaxase/mobilization nuclease domain-containing protein [Chitinophaga sp.]|uniref:relaxase/mobilization nuclease domain-containing protein n=1 Tax=Chitinophaga sp. TaxID=1869181 RepID=UPI002C69AE49|nr:relaxase/mobilization nuclease domain-containing protein [Chitinophaga sp.]HVI49225.1 relaxase/mobilization nuclease domain-containing protein [Chitinophaga sp.]
MISKVFDGHSFYHACRYVCKKPGAEVLATEGVRNYDHKLMAADFVDQASTRPSKKQACFHSVLSFHPNEKPDDATVTAIAQQYLKEIGITNTQVAITKHTDKAHLHVHIIANMVNNDGKSISDKWIGLRGKRAAQKLTMEYRLIQAEKKDLALTHPEALSQSEANRYKIYMAITAALPYCKNLQDLESRLKKEHGIEVQYKYKGQSQDSQGVSFKIGEYCFKGSKVDRQYSLGNLEKILSQQQRQVVAPRLYPGKEYRLAPISNKSHNTTLADISGMIIKELTTAAIQILNDLMKPDYIPDRVPYELFRKPKKRYYKKQS